MLLCFPGHKQVPYTYTCKYIMTAVDFFLKTKTTTSI